VNDEFENMWKDAVVALFRELTQHLPRGTEKNHENLSRDSRYPSRELNTGPPKYATGKLTTLPRRSMTYNGITPFNHT
jgi:hypothetical protein